MNDSEVKAIVRRTVKELMRNGMLKRADDVAYSETSSRLFEYFKAPERDQEMGEALEKVKNDFYFEIITAYYRDRRTIDEIAARYDCEISTVSRNKKRMCLKIHQLLQ